MKLIANVLTAVCILGGIAWGIRAIEGRSTAQSSPGCYELTNSGQWRHTSGNGHYCLRNSGSGTYLWQPNNGPGIVVSDGQVVGAVN